MNLQNDVARQRHSSETGKKESTRESNQFLWFFVKRPQASRFRVALPNEDIVFNRTFLIDVIYLEMIPVLNKFCEYTLFNINNFL